MLGRLRFAPGVPFNGVSVVGGIQPEKLADALFGKGKPDDGLVARFLWAWPDRPSYQRPRRCGDYTALSALYDRLDSLGWGIDQDGRDVAVTLPLDGAAADVFEQFERANRDAGDEASGLYKSFCGKLGGMVLRLALVSELSRWAYAGGPEPRSISATTIASVAEFVDEYAKPTALRVFGDAALPLVERNAATLARLILRHELKRVNARELKRTPYKQHLPGMREADPLNEALAFLVEADWLKSVGQGPGTRPAASHRISRSTLPFMEDPMGKWMDLADPRRRPRHGPRSVAHRCLSDLTARAEEGRDAVRAPQTDPQARSTSPQRPQRSKRRVPPRRHRPEPPQDG